MAGRFITTTKDVGLLKQLHDSGQLSLTPEFQRNAVWSRPARAYLIDTILSDSPIPVLYFQRSVNAQTSRVEYAVIDGQQRLNSIFLFMENRFSLTESEGSPWHRRKWKDLSEEHKAAILSYDFVVQELSGYSTESVRDMFGRMNRYVVALNPQELRHSAQSGAFKSFVERVGRWDFWVKRRVVTPHAQRRMKADELVAELIILLNEGPQDKKESVDLYYTSFQLEFESGERLEAELIDILTLIDEWCPELARTPLRKPANLYALVGAISEIRSEGLALDRSEVVSRRLADFLEDLERDEEERSVRGSRYFAAQSRQTDNIRPRRTRIDLLKQVILGEG